MWRRPIGAFVCFLFCLANCPGLTRADQPATQPLTLRQIFRDRGLVRLGFLLILPDETKIHAAVDSLRGAQADLPFQLSAVGATDADIVQADQAITEMDGQYLQLTGQLTGITDPTQQAAMSAQISSLATQIAQREAALDELKDRKANCRAAILVRLLRSGLKRQINKPRSSPANTRR